MTMPLWLLSLLRQLLAAVALLVTSVELIAHSLVPTSRNFTAPVSRYSLVRQLVVPTVEGVTAAAVARVTGLTGAAMVAGLTGAATLAGLGALATTAGLTVLAAARYFSCGSSSPSWC